MRTPDSGPWPLLKFGQKIYDVTARSTRNPNNNTSARPVACRNRILRTMLRVRVAACIRLFATRSQSPGLGFGIFEMMPPGVAAQTPLGAVVGGVTAGI
jgi:hypothetical protein